MKLKMSYSKILSILICIITCNSAMAFYSKNWVELPVTNKDIKQLFIDTESINEHNNSLYYAIQYYKNAGGGTVAIVQSKGTKAGIVETYTPYDYNEILAKEQSYPPYTPKTATKFNEITQNSLLYIPNEKAMLYTGFNGDLNLGQADFTEYINKLQRKIKTTWLNSWDYVNIKNVGTGNVVLTIKISKDGRLLKSDIKKSSGSEKFDKSAIEIIKSSQRQLSAYSYAFEQLPNGFNGNSVDIQVILNRNTKQVTATVITPNVNVSKTELYTKDNVDYSAYMKDVQKRIKRNWYPPNYRTKKVVVLFKISKTGDLISCNVYKSSGDTETDNAAIKAVKNTKFKPLPQESTKESIDIQFSFGDN